MTSPFSGHETSHVSPPNTLGSTELQFYYEDPGGYGHTGELVEEPIEDLDEVIGSYPAGEPEEEDLHATAENEPEEVPTITDPVTAEEQGDVQQEELTDYELIVEAVATTIEPHTHEEVAKMRGSFIQRAGYNAERTAFADPIRKELAGYASRDTDAVLEQTRDVWSLDRTANPDDVIGSTLRHVANDALGEKPGGGLQRPIDSVYFAPGSEVRDAVENGDLDTTDPVVQAKLEIAVTTLSSYGLYKMNAWTGSHSDTLMEGLQLMEACVANIPDFDPERAGYDSIKQHLMNTLAAVQADNFTKPNYQFTRPDLRIVNQDVRKALHIMHRIEALKLMENYSMEELLGAERANEITDILAERERAAHEQEQLAA
jgi:hypothetical protein